MKYLILFFFMMGCAHKKVIRDELSLVIGCSIYNMDGKIHKSFPGEECVFFDDGTFVTYNSKKKTLQKYDQKLSEIWSLNIHVHHGIHITEKGDLLINSSEVQKKIRYDKLLLVSQDGKIKNSFSFADHLEEIKKNFSHNQKYFVPYATDWEKNLDFTHEYTHLAASYEVSEEIKNFAPKGSYLLTFNSLGRGVYVLSADFSKLISYRKLPYKIFHDVQRFSDTEIVYFVNTSPESPAHVEVYDVVQNNVTRMIDKDFFAYFAGAIQFIDQRLFLVTDSNSNKGAQPVLKQTGVLSIEGRIELSKNNFSRVVLMTDEGEVIKELHFDFKFNSAKLVNVQKFLAKNIGL